MSLGPPRHGWGTFQRRGQRAPSMSSAFVGISSMQAAGSRGSSVVFRSTADVHRFASSTQAAKHNSSHRSFTSSHDILTYLHDHPDYQRLPSSNLDAIVATIISGLATAGSVVLVCVSGSATIPVLFTSLGYLGDSVRGWMRDDFSWANMGENLAVNTALTLLTFGAGYGAGRVVGVALRGKQLADASVKAIGAVAGAIAGAGARTGGFLIIRKLQGRTVEAIDVVLQGVQGLVNGATYGYMGADAVVTWRATDQPLGDNPAALFPEEAFQDPPHRVVFDQTVIEVWDHPDIGSMGLVTGWQNKFNTGGAGLVHIMHRHPDVFRPLGFTTHEVTLALRSGPGSPRFQEIADAFLHVVRQSPLGTTAARGNSLTYVWAVGDHYQIQATVSEQDWAFGARSIIQANRVRLGPERILPLRVRLRR